jgi:hypothetical protein
MTVMVSMAVRGGHYGTQRDDDPPQQLGPDQHRRGAGGGRPVSSTPSPSSGPTPRGPITAPPAPRALVMPHNLYTRDEVVAALQQLAAGGLGPYQEPYVRVQWRSGGDRRLLVGELTQISDIDDVRQLWLHWTYADDSTVSGHLLNRPTTGKLTVEHDGQALASATACRESLRGLRQQRASVRGVLAGSALLWVLLGLFIALVIAGLLRDGGNEDLDTGLTAGGVVLNLVVGMGLSAAGQVVISWVRRRTGGTRLAHPSEVNRTVFTAELGVLATVLATVFTAGALIVAIIALA